VNNISISQGQNEIAVGGDTGMTIVCTLSDFWTLNIMFCFLLLSYEEWTKKYWNLGYQSGTK